MAKFDSLMKATFNPPRNWTLLQDLKFYSDKLTEEQAEMLRHCNVQVRNSTKTKQYIITVPKKYDFHSLLFWPSNFSSSHP